MTTENIGLFQAMGAKLKYLDQRQKVISQNIANADTPEYKARDLTKVDFGTVLKKVQHDSDKVPPVRMAATNPNHLPLPSDIDNARINKQKMVYETAPDKNGVVMEEQLVKANDVQMNYTLMLNLYKSNIDMMRSAIGRR
jgi:flagellar basal-body rod protein FlgB